MSCFRRTLFDEEDLAALNDYFTGLYKLTLFGDCGVGKSALLSFISKKDFPVAYEPTIGVNFAVRRIHIPTSDLISTSTVTLQVWDTSGDDKFKEITRTYAFGHGIILAFDVTNEESFIHIRDWATFARVGAGGNSAVLVGNKCDMPERAVSQERAVDLANEIGALGYFEVSASSGAGVDTAFAHIVHEMRRR